MKLAIALVVALLAYLAPVPAAATEISPSTMCLWTQYPQDTLRQLQADETNLSSYNYILDRNAYDLELILPQLTGDQLTQMQTFIHAIYRVSHYSGDFLPRLDRRIRKALQASYPVEAWTCAT